MIVLENISVRFQKENKEEFHAVREVSLRVEKGEICGIVGFSGAGKSTLIRTMNLLQRPDGGSVRIDGEEITKLSEKELRRVRKDIGMIFQHFYLMNSRNVRRNIAYPLEGSGMKKAEIEKRVDELLHLVELTDKGEAYPSQLSGGQKQRVAIARALASHPKILLCDEATSALDPKTTRSILSLLQSLNQRLGITIVLITHQMEVVKQICTKVAVMEGGRVVEEGRLFDIFSRPQHRTTRSFVSEVTHSAQALETIYTHHLQSFGAKNEFPAKLSYTGESAEKPIISELYSRFSVKVNILFGNMEVLQGKPYGNLIVIFSGEESSLRRALAFLDEQGVRVERLDRGKPGALEKPPQEENLR